MVFQAAKRIATLNAAHEGLVFGRLDLSNDGEAPALHRPDRAARRAARLAADRLAGPGRGGVLPGHGRGPPGRRAAPGAALRRRQGRSRSRTTCSTPRPRRDLVVVGEGALMAQLVPGPGPHHALHRRHHPGRAGQGDPRAQQGRGVDLRRPRHRQDRGRAAPRGVPALQPTAARYETRRRADHRPVRRVHALHRAGAAVARRDRGGAALPRRGRRRDPVRPARRAGGRRRQGRRADGRADASYGAAGGAGRARPSCGCSTATTTSCSAPRELARLRRQLLSQGHRNRQVPRVASALLDAMWRQVRGERGRQRGREEFNDTMLGTPAFVDFALAWWPPLDAVDVLGWLRDPELLGRVAEGVLDRDQQALLSRSWGPVREPAAYRVTPDDWSVEDVRAARRAALPARRRAREAQARRPRRRQRPAGAPVRRRASPS